MKKVLALSLAIVLALALAVPVYAGKGKGHGNDRKAEPAGRQFEIKNERKVEFQSHLESHGSGEADKEFKWQFAHEFADMTKARLHGPDPLKHMKGKGLSQGAVWCSLLIDYKIPGTAADADTPPGGTMILVAERGNQVETFEALIPWGLSNEEALQYIMDTFGPMVEDTFGLTTNSLKLMEYEFDEDEYVTTAFFKAIHGLSPEMGLDQLEDDDVDDVDETDDGEDQVEEVEADDDAQDDDLEEIDDEDEVDDDEADDDDEEDEVDEDDETDDDDAGDEDLEDVTL